MIQRRKPLSRKTPLRRKVPLKRGGPIVRKSYRIPRIKPKRKAENASYSEIRKEYLNEHPYCQITIALHGLNETEILEKGRGYREVHRYTATGGLVVVPRANQIHHRNKGRGARLVDRRWFMSAANKGHDWVEGHKDFARDLGLLLPIQADAEGRWGAGNQGLTTDELLDAAYRKAMEEAQ